MTSSPARLLGLFQVSERLLQPIRRAIGHVRPLLTGYYTLSALFLPPCRLERFGLRDDVVVPAGGRQKVGALRGALAGRFLNVLVTDEDTALALVGSRQA